MKNRYYVIPNQMPKNWDQSLEINFLFPLKHFCVGFLHEYEIDEIPSDAFLYVNRILDESSILKLKELLEHYSFEGIVFEDLGVYELVKNKSLKKIFYATHASCSLKTVETYLQYMDEVILSPDITEEEMDFILKKVSVGVYLYGPVCYMYSRRQLLKNYQNYYHLPSNTRLKIKETKTKKKFVLIENEYGTVIFSDQLFYEESLLSKNASSYLINLDWEEENFDPSNLLKKEFTTNFFHQKTIYRLPPKEGGVK